MTLCYFFLVILSCVTSTNGYSLKIIILIIVKQNSLCKLCTPLANNVIMYYGPIYIQKCHACIIVIIVSL